MGSATRARSERRTPPAAPAARASQDPTFCDVRAHAVPPYGGVGLSQRQRPCSSPSWSWHGGAAPATGKVEEPTQATEWRSWLSLGSHRCRAHVPGAAAVRISCSKGRARLQATVALSPMVLHGSRLRAKRGRGGPVTGPYEPGQLSHGYHWDNIALIVIPSPMPHGSCAHAPRLAQAALPPGVSLAVPTAVSCGKRLAHSRRPLASPCLASPSVPTNVRAHHQARACVAVGRDCPWCHEAARTLRRANRPAPVTTGRHQLPVEAFEEPRAARVVCRAGRAATHPSGRVRGRVQRWHGTCTRSVQQWSSSGKARHTLSST